MDVFRYHVPGIVEYENCFIRVFPEKQAWWGEVIFPGRKYIRTHPCADALQATIACKLKVWEAKIEAIEEPAALVNLKDFSVLCQNLIGVHLFGDARFKKVSNYTKSPLELEGFLRSCDNELTIYCDLQAKHYCYPALMKGRLIHLPEPFVLLSAERQH